MYRFHFDRSKNEGFTILQLHVALEHNDIRATLTDDEFIVAPRNNNEIIDVLNILAKTDLVFSVK